ncbi:MAG: hypothetical protein GWN00_34210 [Aliifodinibius sp.]|nr:hypothetical protein [Fodinibius sp.]NIY29658.1 hypothetical protein [Fodinibius sp.]
MADQLVTNNDLKLEQFPTENQSKPFSDKSIKIPQKVDQLLSLYEELLLQFPNGFYATFARDRIQELEEIQV